MQKKRACIDASVALKLVVAEEDSDKAHALWQRWARAGVYPVAPPLLPFECISALRRMVVRGDLAANQAVGARDRVLEMPVRLSSPRSLFTRAWQLATKLQRPQVYDSFYLATAELLDAQLWTADERFYNAAVAQFEDRIRLLRSLALDTESDA